jgi:hypothetical protein
MTDPSCTAPIPWDTLFAYWLGELEPDSAEQVEEHYLGCAQCSQRLEQAAALARGIRDLARRSSVNMVVDDGFVSRLREEGRQVREYRLTPNGSVNCTVTAEDDFVVGRLEAPLTGVQRIDMVTRFSFTDADQRQEDIPFVADSGVVVVSPSIDALRAMPASSLRVQLLAVDNQGERIIGEYTFNHTPHPSTLSD